MKVGIFLTNQQQVGADQVVALDEQIDMLHAARDAGWDSVHAGQHYLSTTMSHIQPLPYLGRLAAEAGDMQVGIGILLLPLQNPVDVAENFASLDVVTRGRLIFGVGMGYREPEYEAFGVDPSTKVRRFTENLDIILRLWAGEEVTTDLPWCRLDGARLNLPPVQQPRPPVWMAANGDVAVRRAARLADAWMINPHAALPTVSRQVDLYRQEQRDAGRDDTQSLPLMREIFCAKDRRTAVERAAPYISQKYRAYAQWGQDQMMPEKESFAIPYEELAAERFIVGSPEDCIEALRPWCRLGVDHLVLRTHWAGLPVEDALESIRLLATEVIPALESESR
ncbi:LLM class flavin-dependent oxidoreductase [Aeromicrobium duanguangcaii]|uniref:LLM class flavin-dependent oxidoreductase n=1 Tax=Aeromicrobium duanguangcaii TaxID=2968086 RepID=A0ABY5KEE9_9ACTN|nr:LLM class flavin-dependent oxidoreductase [Aeromicrobium duanguangcaii]MCD9155080.1 LLM class flavin-dependent oxidoreductase [Aeromicrobium duanguangcaii]UUI68265.1 LLM class flavin-dependent oxidoreductase [Aeromicrobium duanguangcaii]